MLIEAPTIVSLNNHQFLQLFLLDPTFWRVLTNHYVALKLEELQKQQEEKVRHFIITIYIVLIES